MRNFAEAGIVHLRLVIPSPRADEILGGLRDSAAVINVIHVPNASIKPSGDLVLCDVAREEVSVVIEGLKRQGIEKEGSISVDAIDSSISHEASRASLAAHGSAADAVIWEEIEARTSESAELSLSFAAFMVLATLIAAIGILTDSQILIIGAMVVGPEFGPLAGFCVALVERRPDLAKRSFKALVVGFPLAIVVTVAVVLILQGFDQTPKTIDAQGRATFFIAHPDVFSVLVALIAGTAGLLSLTTAKSGALMGVLISVTTIPAAANVGVALAYADPSEFRGALAQLGLNLFCIVVAGSATLAVQRRGFRQRLLRS